MFCSKFYYSMFIQFPDLIPKKVIFPHIGIFFSEWPKILFPSIQTVQNMLIVGSFIMEYQILRHFDPFYKFLKKITKSTFFALKENIIKIQNPKNRLFWSKIFQKSEMSLKSSPKHGFSIPNNGFLIGDL